MIKEVKDFCVVEIEKRPIDTLVKGWIAHVDRKSEINRKNLDLLKEETTFGDEKLRERIIKLEVWAPKVMQGLSSKLTKTEGDEIRAHF